MAVRTSSIGRLLRRSAVRTRQGNLTAAVGNRVRERLGRPRRLLPHPQVNDELWSSRRLNRLLPSLASEVRYLEIGIHRGTIFDTIEAAHRIGVDPAPLFDTSRLPEGTEVSVTTSDAFFSGVGKRLSFHLVFADGLHQFQQTYRDVINAFQRLEPRGLVVVDDVVPSDAVSAMADQRESLRLRGALQLPGTGWHGDVFRTLCVLRDHHPHLAFRTIVGSGNEQALMWNSDPHDRPTMIDEHTLDSYASITYEEVFADGIPGWFKPADEDDAIGEALATIGAR